MVGGELERALEFVDSRIMAMRTTLAAILFGFGVVVEVCHESCFRSVAAQSAWKSYSGHELYAMEQLWDAWGNNTPDLPHNLAGWNAHINAFPPCAQSSPWQGVFCNAQPAKFPNGGELWDFEIVGLTLRNTSIVGNLPAAIGNLTNLVTITLSENPGLSGPLPEEFGYLLSLFDLDLHGNGFSGDLPKFFMQSFGFLQSIDLSSNQLTGPLPENMTFSYRTIQTMNMSHNLFSGPISSELVQYLSNLVSADLSHNNFTGGIPKMRYPNKTKLLYLDLSSNRFSGPLPMMSHHPTIRLFNASHNLLSGELEASLSEIPFILSLDISRNQFTGPIPDLTSLPKLKYLDLSYNHFTPDSFPSWATKLKDLQTLMLRGASITGAVPLSVLGSFESLETLGLDDNNMTGTLHIDKLLAGPFGRARLQFVSLARNKINDVVYTDRIDKLDVKFNLSGNPYCDYNSNRASDLKRCVCHQQCYYVGNISSNRNAILISLLVAVTSSLVVFFACNYFFCQGRRESQRLIHEANQKFAEYEVKPTLYTYAEIRMITNDFHPAMKLGQGHYGAVYKGRFANGNQVAVKQLLSQSQQSLDIFLNEVVLVAAVKHRNLVKLKGCCIRSDQRLLVYEYVEVGDLEQLLFEPNQQPQSQRRPVPGVPHCVVPLSWSVRQRLCLGVAHGLHYLHSLSQPRLIHRDIKASNILLDHNLEPKIADFGLALLVPDDQSHIMTVHVAGTRGYLAPEYATLGQLSEKVDVYSFGVVLLEIVSGRKNIDCTLPEDKMYLLDRAWRLRLDGKLLQLIDPGLHLQTRDELLDAERLLNISFLCVQASADKRPNMADVVAMLQGGLNAEIAELTQLREAQTRLENQFDCSEAAAVRPQRDSELSTVGSFGTGTGCFRDSGDGSLPTVSSSFEIPVIEWVR